MIDWSSLPDRYWHCAVALGVGKKDKDRSVANDLTRDDLRTQIVEPWRQGHPFVVGGVVVSARESVAEIRITCTNQTQRYYADQHDVEMHAASIADFATNRLLLPLGQGTDYTHRLLFEGVAGKAIAPDVELLLRICQRLPEAARVLAVRKRGRVGFAINDEYDAQDLLHALVRTNFKYAVAEEPIGIVGGGPSSRADLALEDLGVLIELKYARGPSDQDRMVVDGHRDP